MKFETSRRKGVLVIKLSGNLRGHPDCYHFLDKAREKIENQSTTKVVIDLGGVEKIDSAGVGVLASIVTSANNSGASLVFSSIPKRAEKMIVLVGLMRVLDVEPTLDVAVQSLADQPV